MARNLNAFCLDSDAYLEGNADGPLSGLTFAAKDIFDVSGNVTGCGNPDWKTTHGPAIETAWAITALTAAGATMVGKTITDELTRGILGENVHYGTPVNPRAPGRVPGGSSSGSAAAVAGGVVDFAIGSDTGGSVRIPASFCGLFGLRPTHGRIPVHGMLPQAPSFDTLGWFADDIDLFSKVGSVLLGNEIHDDPHGRLLIAEDAFAVADPEVVGVLRTLADRIAGDAGVGGDAATITLAPTSLAEWSRRHQVLQGREAWRTMGEWISRTAPRFSPQVARSYAAGKAISDSDVEEASSARAAILERVDTLLNDGAVICMPTAPGPAPLLDQGSRAWPRIGMLTCVASTTGVPQLTMPLAMVDGLPVGLSLIGRRGADETLIALARKVVAHLED